MAYTTKNFKTKRELRIAIKNGENVNVYVPNSDLFASATPINGPCFIEGPHSPKPHTWYAKVELFNGIIVKVVS